MSPRVPAEVDVLPVEGMVQGIEPAELKKLAPTKQASTSRRSELRTDQTEAVVNGSEVFAGLSVPRAGGEQIGIREVLEKQSDRPRPHLHIAIEEQDQLMAGFLETPVAGGTKANVLAQSDHPDVRELRADHRNAVVLACVVNQEDFVVSGRKLA